MVSAKAFAREWCAGKSRPDPHLDSPHVKAGNRYSMAKAKSKSSPSRRSDFLTSRLSWRANRVFWASSICSSAKHRQSDNVYLIRFHYVLL